MAGGGGNLLTTLLEGNLWHPHHKSAPGARPRAWGRRGAAPRGGLRPPGVGRGPRPSAALSPRGAAHPRPRRRGALGGSWFGIIFFNRLTFHLQRDTCLSHLPLWWDTAETWPLGFGGFQRRPALLAWSYDSLAHPPCPTTVAPRSAVNSLGSRQPRVISPADGPGLRCPPASLPPAGAGRAEPGSPAPARCAAARLARGRRSLGGARCPAAACPPRPAFRGARGAAPPAPPERRLQHRPPPARGSPQGSAVRSGERGTGGWGTSPGRGARCAPGGASLFRGFIRTRRN